MEKEIDLNTLKSMQLHDEIKVKLNVVSIRIIRVPNGWLYKYPANDGGTITFVPEKI